MAPDYVIRPVRESDREQAARILVASWTSNILIIRERRYDALAAAGFVAEQDGEIAGLVTYQVDGDDCLIISLDSLRENIGIGSALVEAVAGVARASGCRRMWLTTTNDNLRALGFYQKRGFVLCALHPGAINEMRKVKPQISLIGENGIPLRDEIELEYRLDQS